MTGVGGRPELVISGSYDEKDWYEYEFPYKPTNPSVMPDWVMPHQPRFDWQLWFSALGEVNQQFYLVHFIYKILNGNTQIPAQLLSYDPFKNTEPPTFIKIDLYDYHFTSWETELISERRKAKEIKNLGIT